MGGIFTFVIHSTSVEDTLPPLSLVTAFLVGLCCTEENVSFTFFGPIGPLELVMSIHIIYCFLYLDLLIKAVFS